MFFILDFRVSLALKNFCFRMNNFLYKLNSFPWERGEKNQTSCEECGLNLDPRKLQG